MRKFIAILSGGIRRNQRRGAMGRVLSCATVAMVFAVYAPAAHAIAMYSAGGMGTVTVVSITGDVILTLDPGPGVEGVVSTLMGAGMGTGDVTPPPPPLSIPLSASTAPASTQMVDVSGSATLPGDFAFSDILTTAVFTAVADPMGVGGVVELLFEYSISALASSGGPDEFAGAGAAAGISDLSLGSLFLDTVEDDMGVVDSSMAAIPVTFILAPGETDGRIFGVDAMGFAEVRRDAVPEPITATLGLMGLSVLGMATRRRIA